MESVRLRVTDKFARYSDRAQAGQLAGGYAWKLRAHLADIGRVYADGPHAADLVERQIGIAGRSQRVDVVARHADCFHPSEIVGRYVWKRRAHLADVGRVYADRPHAADVVERQIGIAGRAQRVDVVSRYADCFYAREIVGAYTRKHAAHLADVITVYSHGGEPDQVFNRRMRQPGRFQITYVLRRNAHALQTNQIVQRKIAVSLAFELRDVIR